MKKLNPSERKKIINLLGSGLTIKETLSTLNLTNFSFNDTRKLVQSFDSEIKELQRKDLNKVQRENIVSLLKVGKKLNEVLSSLNIPYQKHKNSIDKNNSYKKLIEKSKRVYELQQQTYLIKTLKKFKGDLKKSLEHTNIPNYIFNKWRNREEDFNLRLIPFKNIKIKIVSEKLVPKDLMFTKVENGVLYNGKKIIGRFCQSCRTIKPISFFYVNNNDKKTKSTSNCIDCISISTVKRTRNRHGVLRKGIVVKEINSNSNTTHRRCTHCEKKKHLKEFDKLYLGIHVCNKCFKNKPNFNPNRRGEFYKSIKVRWFDNYGYVSHKTCSSCRTKKPLSDFTKNNLNRLDGRGRYCKECR